MRSDSPEWVDRVAEQYNSRQQAADWHNASLGAAVTQKRLDSIRNELADVYCTAEMLLSETVALNDRLFGSRLPEDGAKAQGKPTRSGSLGLIADQADALRDMLDRLGNELRHLQELG